MVLLLNWSELIRQKQCNGCSHLAVWLTVGRPCRRCLKFHSWISPRPSLATRCREIPGQTWRSRCPACNQAAHSSKLLTSQIRVKNVNFNRKRAWQFVINTYKWPFIRPLAKCLVGCTQPRCSKSCWDYPSHDRILCIQNFQSDCTASRLW